VFSRAWEHNRSAAIRGLISCVHLEYKLMGIPTWIC
jgi:hypothetical protein